MTTTVEDYARDARRRVEEANLEIEKLKHRAEEATGETKLELNKKIDTLEERARSIREKAETLKQGADDAVKEARSGIDRAIDDLKAAVNEASSS